MHPAKRREPGVAGELARQAANYGRLMRVHKPIGIWLLLWPILWALWIAGAGQPDPQVFVVFVLGTVVMRSAGCVINDLADRKIDPHVERTRDRPLATGAVAPAEAVVLFIALMLVALGLVLTQNPLTQQLALVGAALTIIYPFMKRFISAPQLALGAAFAWGVPMAFAAQTGEIPRLAWLMALTVVIWDVIFDTEYAMADRADDLKLGVRSTAILFGQADVFIVSLLMAVLLLGLLLMGEVAGLGVWYQAGVGAGVVVLLYQLWLIRGREPERCFAAFMSNRYFGAAIFAGILLDYTFLTA